MNYFVAVIVVFFPTVSWAVDELTSPPDLSFASMIASLLLVIACIFIFAFLMKKTNLVHNGRGTASIKVVATQPLTSKGRVQIVEVNEKRYLLGVTEQNISLLDTFDIPEEEIVAASSSNNATPFATLLSKISTKRHE